MPRRSRRCAGGSVTSDHEAGGGIRLWAAPCGWSSRCSWRTCRCPGRPGPHRRGGSPHRPGRLFGPCQKTGWSRRRSAKTPSRSAVRYGCGRTRSMPGMDRSDDAGRGIHNAGDVEPAAGAAERPRNRGAAPTDRCLWMRCTVVGHDQLRHAVGTAARRDRGRAPGRHARPAPHHVPLEVRRGLDGPGCGPRFGATGLTYLGGLLKHLAAQEDYASTTPSCAATHWDRRWDNNGWGGDNDWEFNSARGRPTEILYALWDDAVARSRASLARP